MPKPTVITLAQMQDAVREAAAVAAEERVVALTDAEARETNGGMIDPPWVMGFFQY